MCKLIERLKSLLNKRKIKKKNKTCDEESLDNPEYIPMEKKDEH